MTRLVGQRCVTSVDDTVSLSGQLGSVGQWRLDSRGRILLVAVEIHWKCSEGPAARSKCTHIGFLRTAVGKCSGISRT